MKPTEYSEKVLDHFRHPRNVGVLEGENVAMGRVGNPVCGDLMEIYIKVQDNKIIDVKFKTFGCGSAIATASMISELAKGKTIDEALNITRKDVADELDGLPPIKMHCSNLAADALRDAIKNYQEKHTGSSVQKSQTAECSDEVPGSATYLHKGVYSRDVEVGLLKDKRIIIIACGQESYELAINVTKISPRVVLITEKKEQDMDKIAQKQLDEAGVKILFESRIIGASGFRELEKVRIHDLNEEEEYDLFVDALVLSVAGITKN